MTDDQFECCDRMYALWLDRQKITGQLKADEIRDWRKFLRERQQAEARHVQRVPGEGRSTR